MSSCSSSTTTTTAEDGGRTAITAVHPDIIQTLILTKLDGPTLISASFASSNLQNLCSDDNLWQKICNKSWPSTSHPLIQNIISTFPSGHRSFFSDSFPSINDQKSNNNRVISQVRSEKSNNISSVISQVGSRKSNNNIFSIILQVGSGKSNNNNISGLISQVESSKSSAYGDLNPTLRGTESISDRPSAQVKANGQELISAVDIHFDGNLLYSKVLTTETKSAWFMSSPFRVELLGHKEHFPTPVIFNGDNENCKLNLKNMKVSWILIDKMKNRAMNISSLNPVSIRRHWLTGDMKVKYSTVIGSGEEMVQCVIVVTCEGKEGGELHVREVSMQVEDMDGKVLNGKDSLVILEGVIEGGRKKRRESEIKENYEKFLELKKIWKEKKQRREKRMDMMCIASGITIFVAFWTLIVLGIRS
ncbi:F-box protein At2g27310-like [Lycium barbarum]|uniref:F-box protein At2g27310-like n=1 Tax=Lycium barbarum TaxID=112863 RepID=UPI00293EEDD6|nr:F-box protein At2g27310-like [Lycium barbarum]